MSDFSPANGDTILSEGTEYRVADLSFSDLRVHYFTGVSVRRLGDQQSKSSGYRNGVMTGLGDLEFPVWEALIRDLIHRSGEDELLNSLIAWLEGTSQMLDPQRKAGSLRPVPARPRHVLRERLVQS